MRIEYKGTYIVLPVLKPSKFFQQLLENDIKRKKIASEL